MIHMVRQCVSLKAVMGEISFLQPEERNILISKTRDNKNLKKQALLSFSSFSTLSSYPSPYHIFPQLSTLYQVCHNKNNQV